MLEAIPNRNLTEFNEILMRVGHAHLAPADLAECVRAENHAGSEAYYSEDALSIISFGLEDSVEGDVRAALHAWLEEIAKVLVNDLQGDEDYVRTLRLVDADSLVAQLVAGLALPIVKV